MAVTRGPFVLDGSTWRGHNRANRSVAIADSFVPDVTKPIWLGTGNAGNNVGCKYGVARTSVASVTQAAGALWENLNITGQVTITQPGQTFRNCRGTFSYSGDSGGGVFYQMASATNATSTYFEFCEVEPGVPGDRYNGIYGHDFKLYRCAITKTVDGVGAYNSTGPNCNVEQASCWVGYLAWTADDYTPSRPNGHSDLSGSHNDGSQVGSGLHHKVHGCFLQGAKYNIANPGNCVLTSDGQGFTIAPGNGTSLLAANGLPAGYGGTANTSKYWPQLSQAFLAQHSAYYVVDDIDFHHNWLWNWDHGFKIMSNLQSGVLTSTGGATSGSYWQIPTVSFHDNVFGGTWRSWGGTQLYYPCRYDSNVTINGVRHTAGGTFDDLWNNVWDPGANVAATYGDGQPIAGKPIRHRVDAVTVV